MKGIKTTTKSSEDSKGRHNDVCVGAPYVCIRKRSKDDIHVYTSVLFLSLMPLIGDVSLCPYRVNDPLVYEPQSAAAPVIPPATDTAWPPPAAGTKIVGILTI